MKDKDGSLTGTNVGYTLYVTQVVNGTLTFAPKADVPTSTILPPPNIGQNAIRIITSENLVNFIGVGY